jgi:hypothetical protein
MSHHTTWYSPPLIRVQSLDLMSSLALLFLVTYVERPISPALRLTICVY